MTNPLVKTLSSDVFPLAPSPLSSDKTPVSCFEEMNWIAEPAGSRGSSNAQKNQLALHRLGAAAERHCQGLIVGFGFGFKVALPSRAIAEDPSRAG